MSFLGNIKFCAIHIYILFSSPKSAFILRFCLLNNPFMFELWVAYTVRGFFFLKDTFHSEMVSLTIINFNIFFKTEFCIKIKYRWYVYVRNSFTWNETFYKTNFPSLSLISVLSSFCINIDHVNAHLGIVNLSSIQNGESVPMMYHTGVDPPSELCLKWNI